MGVLSCVTFHLFCKLSDYTVAGTALSSTLTMGMPAIGPGVVFTTPPARSTEVSSKDCSNHGFGHVVSTMGAAQTLAWPSPHVYVPTKSTVA